jgi:hypothetical protein
MQPPAQRAEMRGPQNTDIDNILSGLKPKTRTVEMQRPEMHRPEMQRPEMHRPEMQRPEMQRPEPNNTSRSSYQGGEDDSIISISSLKDMQNANGPKKSNRRGRSTSEKNTISLDI